MCRRGKLGRGEWGSRWVGLSHLAVPVAELVALFLVKNVPIALGDEIVNPGMESHFLDLT